MNGLEAIGTQLTMSSLALVDLINSSRKEGEAELQHKHFLEKAPKVLGGGVCHFFGYLRASTKRSIIPML